MRNQFIRNDVWILVSKSDDMNIIGTKWVFRNKLDETRMVTIVVKGYNQEEGTNCNETYAPVARLPHCKHT